MKTDRRRFFWRDNTGVTTIEYGLSIAALVAAVAILASMKTVGEHLRTTFFNSVASASSSGPGASGVITAPRPVSTPRLRIRAGQHGFPERVGPRLEVDNNDQPDPNAMKSFLLAAAPIPSALLPAVARIRQADIADTNRNHGDAAILKLRMLPTLAKGNVAGHGTARRARRLQMGPREPARCSV